ncbi:MAG: NADP-dependent oxidoreductase [Steroidobacteraceae bacterium]
MTLLNKQQHLVSRPTGEPTLENFALVEVPVPEIAAGQVLVRHRYLSLDPYMRGRMREGKSYAAPQPLDAVMIGGTAGEVIASRSDRFAVGDQVLSAGGWQQYQVIDIAGPHDLRKVDTSRIPLSAYLGVVGMPGVTAWYGLGQIIAPKVGETVVISAASGAVGSVAGQLARIRGARPVGIAGGPDKCRYVVEELGFDACIDHRRHRDASSLAAALRAACPKGIDGDFENVGGVILDAVMLEMSAFSRIALCGMIAGYNDEPIPMSKPGLILVNRMKVEGFIVSDHVNCWHTAQSELKALVESGRIKYRESIAHGIEAAPQALIDLLKGRNFGKHLVELP